MNTFARRYSVIAPKSRARSIAHTIPRRIPTSRLPVAAANTMLKNAPVRMSPSRAMFSMPASSVYSPPMAASRNGVMIPTALWTSGIAKRELRAHAALRFRARPYRAWAVTRKKMHDCAMAAIS